MIVVKPRYSVRKYCYGGSGVFGNLLSKVVSSTIAQKVVNAATRDGVKNIINKAVSSPIAHKVADSVVDGAASATKRCRKRHSRKIQTTKKRREKKYW